MADDNATPAERFPAVLAGVIGGVLTQSVNVIQVFCECLKERQLTAVNILLGLIVAGAATLWTYRNVWSKASVAKVLDANAPGLTTAQAKAIAQEGPPGPTGTGG